MLKRPRFIVITCRGNRTSRTGHLGTRQQRPPAHAAAVVHDTWLCGKVIASFTTESMQGPNRIERARERAERRCAELNEAYG